MWVWVGCVWARYSGFGGERGVVWYVWGWLWLLLDLVRLVEHVMGCILVVCR